MSLVSAGIGFRQELREICGAEHVTDDPDKLHRLQICGVIPAIAASPGSAEEVAAVLRIANRDGLSIVPAGGLTQQHVGKAPPPIDILLRTSRLFAVEHYDAGDLTVGVGAGCTVAQLSSMVGADGLLFAGDPPLPERATVGGLLAAGMTGPLRHGYGGLRDYCIGIRFVTGDGRKGKGGGRVVKNVAGYDMMKLLIGSRGTLAIITGASFKLFPAPRQTRTFVAQFGTAAEAIKYRDAVLRSPLSPMCLELVSPEAGAQFLADTNIAAQWSICVRAAGSDAILSRYRKDLGTTTLREMEGADELAFWCAVRDFPHNLKERYDQSTLFLLSVPLSEVGAAIHELATVTEAGSLKLAIVGRVGVGHLLAGLWPVAGVDMDITSTVTQISSRLSRHASLAVLSGPEASGSNAAWLLKTPTDLKSMRAVKQALDPNEVLNRGRFAF